MDSTDSYADAELFATGGVDAWSLVLQPAGTLSLGLQPDKLPPDAEVRRRDAREAAEAQRERRAAGAKSVCGECTTRTLFESWTPQV